MSAGTVKKSFASTTSDEFLSMVIERFKEDCDNTGVEGNDKSITLMVMSLIVEGKSVSLFSVNEQETDSPCRYSTGRVCPF